MRLLQWGLALLSLVALPAFAATGLQLSFDRLYDGADAIAVVETLSVRAFEQDGRVLTATTLAVTETLKGKLDAKIQVIQLGGRTEHLATRVAGMPSFVPGEKAVVFLEQPPGVEHFVIFGLEQGKFSLKGDQVFPPVVSMHLLDTHGAEVKPVLEQSMSLPTLRARIAQAKAGQQ